MAMAPTAAKPTAAVTAPAKRTAFATFILSILPHADLAAAALNLAFGRAGGQPAPQGETGDEKARMEGIGSSSGTRSGEAAVWAWRRSRNQLWLSSPWRNCLAR